MCILYLRFTVVRSTLSYNVHVVPVSPSASMKRGGISWYEGSFHCHLGSPRTCSAHFHSTFDGLDMQLWL